MRTKTLFDEQTLKKYILGICRLVPHADFLIFRTKFGLDNVHCPQAIRGKPDTST